MAATLGGLMSNLNVYGWGCRFIFFALCIDDGKCAETQLQSEYTYLFLDTMRSIRGIHPGTDISQVENTSLTVTRAVLWDAGLWSHMA